MGSARLGVTNLNYVTNSSKKERRKDADKVDNAHFQKTGKNSRNFSRSPKSKVRTNPKQKETILNEETKVIAMDLEEDSEDDVRRSLDLQKEIDKEQEYQNQINMIYNSPCKISSSSTPTSCCKILQCISSPYRILKASWYICQQATAPVICPTPGPAPPPPTARPQKMNHHQIITTLITNSTDTMSPLSWMKS